MFIKIFGSHHKALQQHQHYVPPPISHPIHLQLNYAFFSIRFSIRRTTMEHHFTRTIGAVKCGVDSLFRSELYQHHQESICTRQNTKIPHLRMKRRKISIKSENKNRKSFEMNEVIMKHQSSENNK